MFYLRARYYDPSTAQFLSRDPAVASTRQPYAYTYDNPLNMTDPSGLDSGGIYDDVISGIYKFFCAKSADGLGDGMPYVGSSKNVRSRIARHVRDGKVSEDDAAQARYWRVSGNQTSREVAEQLKIRQEGGVGNLANVRNPIGESRAGLLEGNAAPEGSGEVLGVFGVIPLLLDVLVANHEHRNFFDQFAPQPNWS